MFKLNQRQSDELISRGKVGCVILAGGQGTRLGSNKPKGCYPISVVKQKSLFQLLAEKTLAASSAVKKPLSIAFMTSEENHHETVSFFQKHAYFGLSEKQVNFFSQSSLPLLDEQGQALFSSKGAPLTAADGNGSFFWNFAKSGLLEEWQKNGLEYVIVLVIDNPLADPFDRELVNAHVTGGNDITLRAIERQNPEECVGCIIQKNGNFQIIEYSEMSQEEKEARDLSGKLKIRDANISYFCFSLSFIKKIIQEPLENMPLHTAKKRSANLPFSVLKSEYFIFDVLSKASKVGILKSSRDEYFAPLKNKEGKDSPQTVREALLKKDRMIFEAIMGTAVPKMSIFELSQEFYYPTQELIQKWEHRLLPPEGYITN